MPKRVGIVGMSSTYCTEMCMYCGYEITSKTGMRLHLKMKHGIHKGIIGSVLSSCHSCRKDYTNHREFLKHMKKEHY